MKTQIKTSFTLGILIIVVHAGAVIAALLSGFDLPLVVLTCLMVMGSLISSLRNHAFRSGPSAVVALELNPERNGNCQIFRRGLADGVACRIHALFVAGSGVILSLRCPDRRLPQSVVIARDALTGEGFRQLRVRLRMSALAG